MTDIVNGLPLIAVILGLVELSKRAGLAGRGLLLVSFAMGLALGVAYQCSIAVPTTYAGWFGAVAYGLALGLAASGINDWSKQFRPA